MFTLQSLHKDSGTRTPYAILFRLSDNTQAYTHAVVSHTLVMPDPLLQRAQAQLDVAADALQSVDLYFYVEEGTSE